MDIRTVDTGSDLDQVIITASISLKGADAGSIVVLATLPFPMKVTEIRIILTSLLATSGSSTLVKVTDSANNIIANQTINLADTIGTVYTATPDATNSILTPNGQGPGSTDQLVIVTTAGGTASTSGTALVVIKAKKLGDKGI